MSEVTEDRLAESGAVDVSEPGPAARRRIWIGLVLAVVSLVVVAGAAVGYSLLQPTIYGARADFVLTARPELSDAAVDRAMVTQTMVITGDPVLGPVATREGMALSRLRGEVSAEIVGRSDILRLTVGDQDQARALRLVRLIAAQYLGTPIGSPTPVAGSTTGDTAPPMVATLLSGASALDTPLQPRPLRALAAGLILGLLLAAALVASVLRPRVLRLRTPHWG